MVLLQFIKQLNNFMNRRFNIVLLIGLFASSFLNAQFRNRDRMDNLEDFDEKKFSWGFFLAANNYDYKLILDPKYGMGRNVEDKNQNLITSKSSMGFGAGLIGRMRLNENFDLRVEPGLQFVQRDLTFNTQSNSEFAGGTNTNAPFVPLTLTDVDRFKVVKSTYIDVPVLLEFHGNRWYNSRPYAAAGINYMVNVQSNQKSESDNQQNIFRSTTHNFGWSAEIGMQFYFSRFKLTPAVRGTFFTNNELVKDNGETPPYWAAGISQAQTRAVMFVLKFE